MKLIFSKLGKFLTIFLISFILFSLCVAKTIVCGSFLYTAVSLLFLDICHYYPSSLFFYFADLICQISYLQKYPSASAYARACSSLCLRMRFVAPSARLSYSGAVILSHLFAFGISLYADSFSVSLSIFFTSFFFTLFHMQYAGFLQNKTGSHYSHRSCQTKKGTNLSQDARHPRRRRQELNLPFG